MKLPGFSFQVALCGLAVLTIPAFATTPVVTVTSPINGQYGSPVNFSATASSPDCAGGISAMRIYTAPGVAAYTTFAAKLDVDINLAVGSAYNTVVQAWDNCGGVGKTEVNVTVISTNFFPPRFVYITQPQQGIVAGYIVNPQSGELTFNGQPPVWAHWGPWALASDSGGNHLYVANEGSLDLSAYSIDRTNGHLTPVPGANFPIGSWTYQTGVAVHPSNKFVYVATDRNGCNCGTSGVVAFSVASNGSLTPVPGSPFLTGGGNIAIAVDPKGKYLYTSGFVSSIDTYSVINAFKINQTTGALTALAGSPFPIIPVTCPACSSGELFDDLTTDRNGNFLIGPGYLNGVIYVYRINRSTGSLAEVAGSPFVDEEPRPCKYCAGAGPTSVTVSGNNGFVIAKNQGDANNLVTYQLDAVTGGLTMYSKTWGPRGSSYTGEIRADSSGSLVYTLNQLSQPGTPFQMIGYMIDQANGSLNLVPGAPYPAWQSNETVGITVTR